MSTDNEEVKEKKKRGRPKKVAENDNKETKRGGKGKNGNLISFDQLTEEERRAISTKAGVASGEARRRKKELREFTRDFLMQEAAPVLKQNLSMLGVDRDDMSNLAAMVVRVFTKATNQGDLNAARTIIEWAGMAPLQQEKENEAIAKMAQVMQLASQNEVGDDSEEEDVVFYIPDNGRGIIKEEELVTVE